MYLAGYHQCDIMSKLTKAQEILLGIFGQPSSGFSGVGLPTELETVRFWMWLMELKVPVRGGGNNRSIGHTDAIKKIANGLEVQWRFYDENIQLVNKKCLKNRVNKIINRAKALSAMTYNLNKETTEDWYAKERASFLSTVDIEINKTEVSHEVTKHASNISNVCSMKKARNKF